ncbi:unnamed protein product [Rhizophagus irregularis]|nr:unnamed protein product [Rhizophagus irregularis]
MECSPLSLIHSCESDYLPTTNTANKKRMCCGKPELSVLVTGAIENIASTELELWLQETNSLSFEHIIKKQENDFLQRCTSGPKKLVDYHIIGTESSDQIRPPSDLLDTEPQPRTDDISYQIVQLVEQSLPKSQYALYNNNKDFILVNILYCLICVCNKPSMYANT